MSSAGFTLSDALLQRVSDCIESHTGLYFPQPRWIDLERGLAQAAREAGSRDVRTYAESMISRELHAVDLEILAGNLTIGETHFLRDSRASEMLETTLLPDLIAAKRAGNRRLRIWSAGCASGEEPYSLAMLLDRLIPDLADWHISILGTDLNPRVLARATTGIYSEWSFRGTPDWVKSRCFTPSPGNRYAIVPRIKNMVTFACLNLAEDNFPSLVNNTNAMDLIVCRNVLLYFSPARIQEVVGRFQLALVDGGQFVLGAVEASQMVFPNLTPVEASGFALYRKGRVAAEKIGGMVDTKLGRRIHLACMPDAGIPPRRIHFPAASISARKSETPASIFPSATPRRVTAPEPPAETPQALFDAGRYREARERLLVPLEKRGKVTSPQGHMGTATWDPQVAALLAKCYANLGELGEALEWCERALALVRTDPDLHFLQGVILQELAGDDKALTALRNVLYLDPGHILAHFTAANIHRRHNRQSAAARHLAEVRRLLARCDEGDELPQSGGLTAGRLGQMIPALTPL